MDKKTTIDNGHIVNKYNGVSGSVQKGFHILVNPDGHPVWAGRLGQSGTSGYYKIIADEYNAFDGSWHNLTGTVDQNEWNFWVDGSHIGTVIGNSSNPSLICPEMLAIGFNPDMGWAHFGGYIDEVRVYNRVLNNSEINLLADISFIDSSYSVHQDTQLIAFPQQWSIFSTYITPVNPEINNILSAILPEVSIVKDGDGMVYIPSYGINQINTLSLGQGYQIKLNSTQNIAVVGMQVYPEYYTIQIPSGWSILGYLRDNPAPAEIMFSSISSNISIVKDGSGNVYWLAYGINMIGNLQPGEGYQIKLIAAQNFIYPAN